MQITFPVYYKKFTCIADKCPATCCAGWQIMIDDKSLKKYSRFRGAFRNRLHNDIDWKEHAFRQYDRRCAFLNEENLCDIYSEAGSNMLCDTCRKYPRHIEEYEGLREVSLSLSCPEAARILLTRKSPVRFVTVEKSSREETYDDFDYLLFTALMDTRDYLISVIQDRSVPLTERCLKLLACARDFQLCLNKNELYRWEEIRSRHQASGYGDKFLTHIHKWLPLSYDLIDFKKKIWNTTVPQMEILSPDWPEFLSHPLTVLYKTATTDHELRKIFKAFITDCADWEIQVEQILVYWIYTYFCGAVYDDQILAKAKMALVCTLMIQDLAVGTYLKKGRQISTEDIILICYRFSRELEHSDLNLNQMEKLMNENDIFLFKNLLILIKG